MPRPKGYGKSMRMSRMQGESRLDEEPPSRSSKKPRPKPKPTSSPAPAVPVSGLLYTSGKPAADGYVSYVVAPPVVMACSRCKTRGKFGVVYKHPSIPAQGLCSWCFDSGKRLFREKGAS